MCVLLLASHNSSLSCWPGRTLLGTSLVSLFSSSASGFFEFFIVLRFPLVCVDGSFSSSIDPDLASRRASLRGTRTPRSHYWSPFRSFRLHPVEEDHLPLLPLCRSSSSSCCASWESSRVDAKVLWTVAVGGRGSLVLPFSLFGLGVLPVLHALLQLA